MKIISQMGNALRVYMKVGMWSNKPKAIFLGRYCMLQSWPDYSDPTVVSPVV